MAVANATVHANTHELLVAPPLMARTATIWRGTSA